MKGTEDGDLARLLALEVDLRARRATAEADADALVAEAQAWADARHESIAEELRALESDLMGEVESEISHRMAQCHQWTVEERARYERVTGRQVREWAHEVAEWVVRGEVPDP